MPRVVAALLLSLLVLLLVLPARAESLAWQPFASAEGRFRVLVPAPPAQRSSTTGTPLGDVVDHTFVSRSARGSYTVSYTDLPMVGIAFKGGSEGIFSEARKALLAGIGGQETGYRRIKVGEHAARELTYTAPGDPGHPPLEGRTRMLLVGRRLYVVDSVLPVDGPREEADRFLGSFEVTAP